MFRHRFRTACRCIALASLSSVAMATPDVVRAQTQAPQLLVPQSLGDNTVSISMATGSTWFATGDFQHICLWNRVDGRFLGKLDFPNAYQNQFAVIPNSRLLAVAVQGGLRIVDVNDFHTALQQGLQDPVRWLHGVGHDGLLAATSKKLLRYDRPDQTPAEIATLSAAQSMSQMYVLSDDESAVAIADYDFSGDKPGTVTVYRLSDGAITYQGGLLPRLRGLALHSSLMVTINEGEATADKRTTHVVMYDTAKGLTTKSFDLATNVMALAFAAAGDRPELVISSFDGIASYDLAGKPLRSSPFVALANPAQLLASDGGRSIVAAVKGAPRLIDTTTLYPVGVEIHASRPVTDAAEMADGRIALVTGAPSELVTLGDTVEVTETVSPVNKLLHSFAGEKGLFAAGADTSGPGGFDVGPFTGFQQKNHTFNVYPQQAAAISVSGDLFAGFSPEDATDHATLLIEKPVGLQQDALNQIAAWRLKSDASFPSNKQFRIEFLPDDTVLAVDEMTGTLQRYNYALKKTLPSIVLPLPKDPNGFEVGFGNLLAERVALTGDEGVVAQPGITRCVRLSDGAIVGQLSPAEPDVSAIAASRLHRYILGHQDGRLQFWDGRGAPVAFAKLSAPAATIVPLEGKNLVVVSTTDGVTHFLDAGTGAERMLLFLGEAGQWLVVKGDGRFDASDFGASGSRWKFGSGTFAESMPVEAYTDDLIRPGLVAELLHNSPSSNGAAPASIAAKQRKTAVLTITSEPIAAGDTSARLTVRVHSTSGVAVRNLRLKRNGVLLKAWTGELHDGEALPVTEAIVAGENRFTAYAYNQDDVKSEDGSLIVYGTGKVERPGELWMIAVGVDDYKNTAFHLHYAVADARLAAWSLAWQRLQIQKTGERILASDKPEDRGRAVVNFTVDLVPSMGAPHVSLLLNADATRDRILSTIRDVSRKARPEDTLVLFFAGHGVALGDRYYLLPQDLPFNGTPHELIASGQSALQVGAISDKDLREAMTEEQAATAALILDACQSGAVVGDQLIQRRGPMNSQGLQQLAYDKNMYLLAASLSTETAEEQAAIEHGVLTYTLFERGLVEDQASTDTLSFGPGLVSMGDWLAWGSKNVQSQLDAGEDSRGFVFAKASTAAKLASHVQRPRLFVPPPASQITVVAISATTLDPLVVSTQPPPGADGSTSLAAARIYGTAAGLPTPGPEGASPAPPLSASSAFAEAHLPPNTLGAIRAFRLEPENKRLLAIKAGAVVSIDLQTGTELTRKSLPEGVRSCDISSTGQLACLAERGSVYVASSATDDSPVTQLLKKNLPTGRGLIHWLDDENLLVLADVVSIVQSDGTIVRSKPVAFELASTYDPASHTVFVQTFKGAITTYQVPSLNPGPAYTLPMSAQAVSSIALVASPGARWLIGLEDGGSLSGLELASGKKMTLPLLSATGLAFTADGKTLFVATLGGDVHRVDPITGKEAEVYSGSVTSGRELLLSPNGLALSASSVDGNLAVWNMAQRDAQPTFEVPGGFYDPRVQFTSDGKLNVYLTPSGSLRKVTVPAIGQETVVSLPVEAGLSMRRDSTFAMFQGKVLRWNLETLTAFAPVTVGETSDLDLSPDGTRAAWILPGDNANSQIRVIDLGTGSALTVPIVKGKVLGLQFVPDGDALVALLAAPADANANPFQQSAGAFAVLPVGKGGAARPTALPNLPCCELTISADAGRMLTVSITDGKGALVDLAQRKLLRTVDFQTMAETQSIDPSTHAIVFGQQDGSVMWWNPDLPELPQTVGTLGSSITSIAFNPAGGFIAAANDGSLGWFRGTPVPSLQATSFWNQTKQLWVTVLPNGDYSVSGSGLNLKDVPAQHGHRLPDLLPSLLQAR